MNKVIVILRKLEGSNSNIVHKVVSYSELDIKNSDLPEDQYLELLTHEAKKQFARQIPEFWKAKFTCVVCEIENTVDIFPSLQKSLKEAKISGVV